MRFAVLLLASFLAAPVLSAQHTVPSGGQWLIEPSERSGIVRQRREHRHGVTAVCPVRPRELAGRDLLQASAVLVDEHQAIVVVTDDSCSDREDADRRQGARFDLEDGIGIGDRHPDNLHADAAALLLRADARLEHRGSLCQRHEVQSNVPLAERSAELKRDLLRVERQRLNALVSLCESPRCRRQTLLAYFGETAHRCGNCDVCLEGAEVIDGTIAAQKALSATRSQTRGARDSRCDSSPVSISTRRGRGVVDKACCAFTSRLSSTWPI